MATILGLDLSASPDAVHISLALGYLPGPLTLFQGVSKVQPGECVVYDLNTKKLGSSFIENKNYLRCSSVAEAISSSISVHLQSKYPISLNLSGGLDSTTILYEAVSQGYGLSTYTTRFDINVDKYNEDALLAARYSHEMGCNHNELLITKKDYLDNFVESYQAIEEPNYNISIPIYLIMAKKQGIYGDRNRVILSGDGGDELFAGYPYYFNNKKYDFLSKTRLLSLMKFKSRFRSLDYSDVTSRWFAFKNFYPDNFINHRRDIGFFVDYLSRLTCQYDRYVSQSNSIKKMMFVDRIFWLASENFIRSDKLYMSQSSELRNPFSYTPLRQFCDHFLKSDEYISKKSNKLKLRNLYSDKIPSYIKDKNTKTGWRAPVFEWYGPSVK